MQCPSRGRRKSLADYLQPLYDRLKSWKTSPAIVSAMTSAVRAWCRQSEIPSTLSLSLTDDPIGRLVKRAYDDQSRLGWGNFIRGFWSDAWRQAQELHFRLLARRITLDKQDTAQIWARKVQHWHFGLFEHLWAARNRVQHGDDPESSRIIRLAKCERAINRLYAASDKIPVADRYPFDCQTKDSLLAKTVDDQESWVTKTADFLRKASARNRARGRLQRSITEYFQLLPTRDG
jgi:hypothetical protein